MYLTNTLHVFRDVASLTRKVALLRYTDMLREAAAAMTCAYQFAEDLCQNPQLSQRENP